MEVQTTGQASFSLRALARNTAITALFVAVALLPAVFVPLYLRVLTTLVLVALLGIVGRTALSAALSFDTRDTPAPPSDPADRPTVSVVIPAYNEEPVLPATIEACKELAYPAEKLEIVLCYEAASTDRTAELCEAAAAADDRFVAVERDEPGGGKAKATNYALQYATGDVIAMVDADHRFKADALERAVGWFESTEDVWCVKGRCYGDNAADSLLALHATVERHIAERVDLFAREVLGGFTIFGGGQAFFRREVFDELGAFDEDVLVEDIDMSSRIHEAGKELRMDPSIITFEENPATLDAWWSQRKRWARGWMQVAVRHLPSLPRQQDLSTVAKLDSVFTFGYAIVPTFLVLALPLGLLGLDPSVPTRTYVPFAGTLWAAIAVAPTLISGLVFYLDRRDGLSHHPLEYAAAFTLWLYLGLQVGVYVAAFIEEFVLDSPSVYTTTSRSGGPSDD